MKKMKSMPIRVRLTFWYCLIFGSILAIIISILYYTHKQAQYREVDITITNISVHVLDDINHQLDEGKKLDEMTVSIDLFPIKEVAVILKNETGELNRGNSSSFFKSHQLAGENFKLGELGFKTITDKSGIRVRTKNTPIVQDRMIIGYIETLYSLNSHDRSIQRFKWLVISLTLFGIAMASIGGWFLAKKTLWRVDLIGKTAKAIAVSHDFEQRVLHIGPPDELGQLTETFNQMLDSLENSYKNQRRFLSDASHELRAPLTTIRGNLDILYKMSEIPETERMEVLSDIRNEAIRMSKLVSDLLSLARADAGQMPHKEVISLSSIAVDVLEEMERWEKGVHIDAQIKEHLNIWGDKNLLKQLLIILLDNAIKYTHSEGKVNLTITEKGQQVSISIKDEGIGIPPEEVPFIFDRFYRTKEAREKSPDGTGLGLSIAKWIVDEHQGNIYVKSNPGEGTEFMIYLPMINQQ